MKRGFTAVLALLVAALVTSLSAAAGNGTPINPNSANPLTLSIIGDLPYSAPQLAAFPSWVDEINGHPKVDAVVHLSDIKSGGTVCSDVKGSADAPGEEWLKVTVDPGAQPFITWERIPF